MQKSYRCNQCVSFHILIHSHLFSTIMKLTQRWVIISLSIIGYILITNFATSTHTVTSPHVVEVRMLSLNAVIRVVALQEFHYRIQCDSLSLCPVPQSLINNAIQYLSDLAVSKSDMLTILTKIPLSIRDAAIFLKGQHHGVGYEAAAVLVVKSVGQLKRSTESVALDDIIYALTHNHLSMEGHDMAFRACPGIFI